MNRSHDAESYVSLISKIRDARPDILISGDFIVGFPEETENDFNDTMSLIKEIEYGQAFSFKYSTRQARLLLSAIRCLRKLKLPDCINFKT